MSKLPRTPDTDTIGDLAVTYVQAAFEERRWKFRRQEGRTDFGIDAEIEVVEKNLVTGHIFKGQVKGQRAISWGDGICTVPVKVSTYNLWKAMSLPVVAFLCDVTDKSVFWCPPLAQTPRIGAQSISLRFDQNQSISTNFESLESFLHSWFTAFSNDNLLKEVSYFYDVFNELKRQFGGDPDMMIDSDTDMKTRLLYRHLIQLRLRLGLPCEELPALDDWYIRSAAMWGDDFQLFWATFEELIGYIEPDYQEAIQELRRRAGHSEPCFENQDLINFFQRLDGDNSTVSFHDERFSDLQFLQTMDAKLKKRGVLKFSFEGKKK